jgi:uncharacterized protein with PIN domain
MLSTGELKFMVDENVGKIARWLRMVGYNARFFAGADDTEMVTIALAEGRILLTRDTRIMERRVVVRGELKAILIRSDRPETQLKQIITALKLDKDSLRPFTLCMECNTPLEARLKEEVRERVPPYVYLTHSRFVACPTCHRIYWPGTHWQEMQRKLDSLYATM